MKRLTLALTVSLIATAAHAQTRSVSGCLIPPRLSFAAQDFVVGMPKNRLVGWIYDLNRSRAVLESGTCTCATWHPSWDGAMAEYQVRFGKLTYNQAPSDAVKNYGAESRKRQLEALRLCSSQGVY